VSAEARKAAWMALADAARDFAAVEDAVQSQRLSDAAKAWAAWSRTATPARTDDGEPVLSFGRNKGKRPSEVEQRDLEWYQRVLAENVDNPEKARWRADNERLLAAVEAALGQ
jgi:hypothetical protein